MSTCPHLLSHCASRRLCLSLALLCHLELYPGSYQKQPVQESNTVKCRESYNIERLRYKRPRSVLHKLT